MRLLLILAYVNICTSEQSSLKIIEVLMPNIILPNTRDMNIECRYDGVFTSFTCFKGAYQFFEYKPQIPSIKKFPVFGIGTIEIVDCGWTSCSLHLESLTVDAGGVYRFILEKRGEQYETDTKTVYVVHQDKEFDDDLKGMAEEYMNGDVINAYCFGGPGSTISWYVNNREVESLRGSQKFEMNATRIMFLGFPPTLKLQCAEFKTGNLTGSREGTARWRVHKKTKTKAITQDNFLEEDNEEDNWEAMPDSTMDRFGFCTSLFWIASVLGIIVL